MRTFSLLVTIVAALALASTASAGAAKKSCGDLSATVGAIQAKNVSCKRARKVAKKHAAGTESPFGFTCTAFQYEGGVTFRCRKGPKRVIYLMAD